MDFFDYFFIIFQDIISLPQFILSDSKPFLWFFAFLFSYIYYPRKQITKDDTAMEASVVLTRSANDACFSQHTFNEKLQLIFF